MSTRRTIDFKLYLTRPAAPDAACQVALLPTPEVGESMGPVTIPAADAPAPELLDALADKDITGARLVELGKRLARCLLPEEGHIRERFRAAVERAGSEGGVRLRLIITDHRLARWPWEYAYLPLVEGPDALRGFLTLNPRISLVRHVPLPVPHPGAEAGVPQELRELRIALVGAVPAGAQALEVERDLENIQRAIGGAEVEGLRVACEPVLRDATVEELERALIRPGSVQVLHFSGHGGARRDIDPFGPGYVEEGFLSLLRDKQTKAHRRLAAGDLARLLAEDGVRLAVLSACRTGDQQGPDAWGSVAGALVAAGVPAVIAMQSRVNDDEAVAFSTAFYGALAAGVSLDEAMSLGRAAMLRRGSAGEDAPIGVEWGVPVLYSRMPDGALFPERMAKAGAAAAAVRHLLRTSAQRIKEGGRYTGVDLESLRSAVGIKVRLGAVAGKAVGASIGEVKAGGSVEAQVDADTVESGGELTGVKIGSL